MIAEYVDKLPVIPATSVEEIKNRLQPFVEAGLVTEPVIDDDHRFIEAWG